MYDNKNNKNILLAITISFAFLILWQYLYEAPRQKKAEQTQAVKYDYSNTEKKQEQNAKPEVFEDKENEHLNLDSKRIFFENDKVKGSLNPIGLKIDDLELKSYKTDGAPTRLLKNSIHEPYFAQFGFFSSNKNIILPKNDTEWQITPQGNNEFLASWKNNQGITFNVFFKLDENYMFDVSQKISNNSIREIVASPFVRIFRSEPLKKEATMISHEGFVVNAGKAFSEFKYSKFEDKKRIEYNNERELFWGGFGDKYWLTSFFYNNALCTDYCSLSSSNLSLNYINSKYGKRFQIDFITEEKSIMPGTTLTAPSKFFAGAKELTLLDNYLQKGFEFDGKIYELANFDKTVDFGIFYFLTKPIFILINFLNSFLHNFGFSIILLTFIIKLILLPVAAKSYISMGKMKLIAPEVNNIRLVIKDKMQANRRIMELYRERDVNPLSGCLPIILQIPVFFALYKVLYISIEMRNAPFIWWITDLSSKDPTSIFNLFGLLNFNPPAVLQIGVLPILLGITTFLQQSLSPKSGDETQNMIIKIMPFMLVFIFAGFPSGIVLYWIVNNIFSIIQQLFVEKIILPKKINNKKPPYKTVNK